MRMLKKCGKYLKQKIWPTIMICMFSVIQLLLADVFESFRDKCIDIYELNPTHILSAPGLTWQACLKKTGVN